MIRAVKAAVSFGMLLRYYGVNWLWGSGEELRGRYPRPQGEWGESIPRDPERQRGQLPQLQGARQRPGFRGGNAVVLGAGSSTEARGMVWNKLGWCPPFATDIQSRGERGASTGIWGRWKRINPKSLRKWPPFPFQLEVDPGHDYRLKRGLTKETLEYFGAGLCSSKGTFSGRLVIPLHDELGRLVGYAGRSLDDKELKYLFPSAEKGFDKKHLLFNFHRLIKEVSGDDRVVVEGFFDCGKVKQAGFPCVTIMGSSLSGEQEEPLCPEFDRVLLLFDGDEAGRTATENCVTRLARRVFVKAVLLPEGKQPDMLTGEELREVLKG